MKKLFKYETILIVIFALILVLYAGSIMMNKVSFSLPSTPKPSLKASSVTPFVSKRAFSVKGSIPYWDEKNAVESFRNNISTFNYINLFLYYLGENGEVIKYSYAEEDKELIELAHENNVLVSAVITNLTEDPGNWSSKRVENVIYNDALAKQHIANIIEVLREFNFDGIIIDYELLKPETRDDYSKFIKKLSIELKKENKTLTTVLHAKTGENVKGESVARYQDWVKLAEYSDQVQIMGYSEHTNEDVPGPIASIGWVGDIINYSQSIGIPLEKVFLGIPLYGYDWDKSSDESAKGLTFKEISELLDDVEAEVKFDQVRKSPMFRYDSHEVWFENAESVYAKAALAKEANYAGVTFWRLGDEDQNVWKTLEKLKSN